MIDQIERTRGRRAVGQYGLMEDAREPADNYETSAEAVDMLLSNVRLNGGIVDPSCGRGAIIKGLLDGGVHKTKVGGSDKHSYAPLPEARDLVAYGKDFLITTSLVNASNIVMNPPFSAADEHVRHALRIVPSGGVVCVLLRMTWIAAKKRADLLAHLTKIIICGRLKMLPPDVPDKGHNGAVDFAWFVFAPLAVSATTIVRAK